MKKISFLFIGSILILSNFILISTCKFTPNYKPLVYLGYCFWLTGMVFWIIPAIQLKNQSKANQYMKSTHVVNAGIYSIIRHPQYFGFMLFNVGFPLITQHYIFIISSVLAMVFLYLGIMQEEKLLIKQFGNQYKDYMQKVPRLNLIRGIFISLIS